MKAFVFLILLFGSNCFCIAQSFNFNSGGTAAHHYYEEIPYKTINGKLIIQIFLEGQKYNFLFDTGAPVTISQELASKLKVAAIAKDLISDVNGTTDALPIGILPEIKLGALSFKKIPSLIFSSLLYRCWKIDGVIGSNLLRNSVVSINNRKHTLILTDQPQKLKLKAKDAIPMMTNRNQSEPIIKLTLNHKTELYLQFDTGDNSFLRLSEAQMNRLQNTNNFILLAKGYGASSFGGLGLQDKADKYLIKFPLLSIGSGSFRGVITETQQSGISGIGSKLLDYGLVTMDFVNSLFYFNPYQPTLDLNDKQWPFQPSVQDDKLLVGVVWEKSQPGVKAGEQIVAVDNVNYSIVDLCELVNNKPILAGKQSAILTIKDERGAIRKVKIVKQ
jgi:hypothetical protein